MLTCFAAVHREAALLAHVGLAQPHTFGQHLAGISGTWAWGAVLGDGGSLSQGVHKHRRRLMEAVVADKAVTCRAEQWAAKRWQECWAIGWVAAVWHQAHL